MLFGYGHVFAIDVLYKKLSMESPDRALSCQILIKRVAVTKIKELNCKPVMVHI